MAESDRLRLKQAALLVRLQALREEQANRDLAAARTHREQARQKIAHAAAAYENDVAVQTAARRQRWLGRVGQELSGETVNTLHTEDEAGLASIEQHGLSQKKARHFFKQAESMSKKAEVAMVFVRNNATRRSQLKLKIQQECNRAEQVREETERDQHSQMVFAQRFAEKHG